MPRSTIAKLLLALSLLTGLPAHASQSEINAFQKSYLNLELTRNHPISSSQDAFDPGRFHYLVGYRQNIDDDWMMGISAGFKLLERKSMPADESLGTRVALWTVTHESYYVLRLDHPTYLLLGPRLFYILPTKAAKLPVQRIEDMRTEIGVALSFMLTHVLSERVLLTARFDRWRGTATMRLHGIETAFGLSYSLP